MGGYFLGLISGTSADGIDAALLDLSADRPRLCHAICVPYSDRLRRRVLAVAAGEGDRLDQVAVLDAELGECFAAAALQLLDEAGVRADEVVAIGSHGQTVRHRTRTTPAYSIQIADPARIVEITGITTVADFRRRDIAAGGEAAPLVPAFHNAVFRDPAANRAVLNLGGIANLTLLPADPALPVSGFDTGPASILLDAWCDRHRGEAFDSGGAWAASGNCLPRLLEQLLADPWFALTPPKSTGREAFHLGWLDSHLQDFPGLAAADVQATLLQLSCDSVIQALLAHAGEQGELIVCGGGARNDFLLQRLAAALPQWQVAVSDGYGIAAEWVEAAAFAWLAAETLAGRPGNLPSVTGARRLVVLGAIYPR